MELDRNNPIPLHLQLKALLVAQISDSVLVAGERLPSERQLCGEFGVSRTTVREALRELDREGLIHTVPGRATYVITPKNQLTVRVSLSGFSADMRREGLTPSSLLLETHLVQAPAAELLRAMRLQPRDSVVMLQRLRLVNEIPLALHTVYLNHRLCPGILQEDLGNASLFALLRDRYNLALARAEQTLYAGLANKREMDLLRLSYPASVLRAERTTFLNTGDVIEYSQSAYCGDWYRVSMHLDPAEG
jgi:GntR family transcriptional regulator